MAAATGVGPCWWRGLPDAGSGPTGGECVRARGGGRNPQIFRIRRWASGARPSTRQERPCRAHACRVRERLRVPVPPGGLTEATAYLHILVFERAQSFGVRRHPRALEGEGKPPPSRAAGCRRTSTFAPRPEPGLEGQRRSIEGVLPIRSTRRSRFHSPKSNESTPYVAPAATPP